MIGQHSAGPVRVWLDTAEVATLTRTPEATVRSWRRRGIGPAYCRVGRRVLYDRSDVDAFVLSGRIETSGVVSAPGPERPPAPRPARSEDDVRPSNPTDVTAVFMPPGGDL